MATEAIQAELQRWVDNGSFRRQSRQYARNIITSRYVFTWTRRPDNSRYMKCRLCVHGFKDMYRQDLDRYSGTSTRWGQRMVVATAVQAGWDLVSLDISVAFLKGMTFEEIQQVRGGPRREVSMQLPLARHGLPSGAFLLRQLEGFESFSDATEVFEMLKGGFGLVDAPNLFTTRVDQVFRGASIPPTLTDPKI